MPSPTATRRDITPATCSFAKRLTFGGAVAVLSFAMAGCGASLPSLTTGSLFGGSSNAAAPAAPTGPVNDPTSRALQVGRTAAQAQKCGFNFDAVKLRSQFIAAEAIAAPSPADIANSEKIYDTAYRATARAIAPKGAEYCTTSKTDRIKTALNRHLTGDYAPAPPEPAPIADEGLFGGSSSSSNPTYKTPTGMEE